MSWREVLFNNLIWKLTAFILACVVWITFHSGEGIDFRFQRDLSNLLSTRDFVGHPITIMKPASDPRNFKLEPAEVDITVSGDFAVLKKLTRTNIQAYVDLSNIDNNAATAQVQVQPPRGVRLEKIDPPEVNLYSLTP